MCVHLNFYIVQLPVYFFELQNFPDEEITVTVSNLRIGNVDHVVVDVEIQL